MRLYTRYIPDVSKHDTPARWYCPVKGGWILIRRMDNGHLLNTIAMLLKRGGKRHRKFNRLVQEAIKRRFPLPDHRWIKLPENYTPKRVVYLRRDLLKETTDIYNPALRD